jgi:signal-transduction protein with cAMP-binding, CBS, and nucleotidyltransferase domain
MVFLPKLFPVMFRQGDLVCSKGQAVDSMFLIESGICACFDDDAKGALNETGAEVFSAGQYFGEQAILVELGQAFAIDWTVQASGTCHLLELTRRCFNELRTEFPPVDIVFRQFIKAGASSVVSTNWVKHLSTKGPSYEEANGEIDAGVELSSALSTAKKTTKTVV